MSFREYLAPVASKPPLAAIEGSEGKAATVAEIVEFVKRADVGPANRCVEVSIRVDAGGIGDLAQLPLQTTRKVVLALQLGGNGATRALVNLQDGSARVTSVDEDPVALADLAALRKVLAVRTLAFRECLTATPGVLRAYREMLSGTLEAVEIDLGVDADEARAWALGDDEEWNKLVVAAVGYPGLKHLRLPLDRAVAHAMMTVQATVTPEFTQVFKERDFAPGEVLMGGTPAEEEETPAEEKEEETPAEEPTEDTIDASGLSEPIKRALRRLADELRIGSRYML